MLNGWYLMAVDLCHLVKLCTEDPVAADLPTALLADIVKLKGWAEDGCSANWTQRGRCRDILVTKAGDNEG